MDHLPCFRSRLRDRFRIHVRVRVHNHHNRNRGLLCDVVHVRDRIRARARARARAPNRDSYWKVVVGYEFHADGAAAAVAVVDIVAFAAGFEGRHQQKRPVEVTFAVARWAMPCHDRDNFQPLHRSSGFLKCLIRNDALCPSPDFRVPLFRRGCRCYCCHYCQRWHLQ